MVPSLQRRRGIPVRFHKVVLYTDTRGNETQMPSEDFIEVRAASVPERASKAEVPGQLEIDVRRLVTYSDLPNVTLFSRVFMEGTWWDIVSPVEMHYGTRQTRHWSVLVKHRPDDGGIVETYGAVLGG